MACPDTELLAAFAVGDAASEERERIESHLSAGCDRCLLAIGRIRAIRRLAAVDVGAPPPPWVLKRAARIPDEARERTVAARVYRFAELVLDTLGAPHALGARSAAAAERQVLFHVDGYDIDVRIAPTDSATELKGQLIPPAGATPESSANVAVFLVSATVAARGCRTDCYGQFSFERVPDGDYGLMFETAGGPLLVESLSVRRSR